MSLKTLIAFPNYRTGKRGVALVIVLSFVVLLTVVVVAFFSRTIADRQLSNSSLNQTKSDLLARSALDVVVGDLKQEIANGSTPSTTNNITVYTPSAAANIIPKLNISPSVATAIPNLIRQSSNSETVTSPLVSSRASNIKSDIASANGRFISPARWNKHYLIPLKAGATDTTPVADFTPPDWVYVKDTGPQVITTPDKTVTGRYAYAIYDEGGLLDVNAAGYPGGVLPAEIGKKGFLGLADLTVLGLTQAQTDNLVGWRNYATIQPNGTFPSPGLTSTNAKSADYLTYLKNNTNGFLKTNTATYNNRTDQAILSRQQLLALQSTIGFPTSVLQYLGTFSREKNAPTWIPQTPSGSTIDYATLAKNPSYDSSTAVNRSLANVRVKTAFNRPGTVPVIEAVVGEPLIKKRFPLSRLSLITQTATADDNSDIYKFFGLKRSSAVNNWTYDHGAPAGTIFRLDQVAQLNPGREPDMFELLQAAILKGSLGVSGGTTAAYTDIPDLNTYQQLIKIGTNIIDQWDEDNFPTTVEFNNDYFYGIENIPYLSEFFVKTYSAPSSTVCRPYLVFELWNPHLQGAAGVGPAYIRVRPTAGVIQMRFAGDSAAQAPPFTLDTSPATGSINIPSADFGTYLIPHVPNLDSMNTSFPDNYQKSAAAPLLYSAIPMNQIPRNSSSGAYYLMGVPGSVMIVLEYLDLSGNWHPYSTYAGLVSITNTGILNTTSFPAPICYGYEETTQFEDVNSMVNSFVKSDPRTSRFGCNFSYRPFGGGASTDPSIVGKNNKSNRPFKSSVSNPNQGKGYAGPRMRPSAANWIQGNGYVGLLVENSFTSTGTAYADADGIIRHGDGFIIGSSNDSTGVNPMEDPTTATPQDIASRPVILNRAFRSVGELGYVFRDVPWKTLDFFSPESADAGLLDVFCILDTDTVAGRVNLNTRQPFVLQAMISGTSTTEAGSNIAKPSDLAKEIVSATKSSPLINRSDLVKNVMSTSSMTSAIGSYGEQVVKSQREAAVRSLAENTTTRTWNLMIDIVAQSGRFPSTATAAADLPKFTVEGEKRYWLHIAIDRFSGEVIDQQLEAIYE